MDTENNKMQKLVWTKPELREIALDKTESGYSASKEGVTTGAPS
jgi:hypothetical protein